MKKFSISGLHTSMITGFFLGVLYAVLSAVVSVLPVSAMPTQIGDAIVMFWGYMNLFSMVVPVQTILSVILLMLTYQAVYLGWKMWHYILRRFRH